MVSDKVLDKDVLTARPGVVTSAQLKPCFACNGMQKESCSKSQSMYACHSPTKFAGCKLGEKLMLTASLDRKPEVYTINIVRRKLFHCAKFVPQ